MISHPISVKVMLFASFREKYQTKETILEFDGTLEGFLEELGKRFGTPIIRDIYNYKKKAIRNDLIVMINGRNVKDIKDQITFNNRDNVAIFPPVCGG